RLRQVLSEKKLLVEALSAFNKVIGQLKKLPRLSAEQIASLTLFEMALEETKINKSELFAKERKLEHYFHIATGHSVDEIIDFLPKSPDRWPTILKEGKLNSPKVTKLRSLADLAQSGVEIEKAKAWPNLRIGPSFAIEKDGRSENKMIGLNIQLPLPLFQVNGGGKAYARSELLRAQKSVILTLEEEGHERYEQQRVYESAVDILKETMKQSVVESKHKRVEKLYLRGVVSSSVLLESLKQKLSYLKSRNLRELTAIEALWSIRKYDGQIFKETL
ncbi:MAG: TolC family protein, partial [Halobacteriovoraceae bacterium]|nr:TolC family protein [Halobacteriovoraceae bacterium]